MPGIDKPPMSPQAQAQMGPPGGPNMGPGLGQAQEQIGKNQVDVALSTVKDFDGRTGRHLPHLRPESYGYPEDRSSYGAAKGAAITARGNGKSSGGWSRRTPSATAVPPMPAQMPG